MGHRKHVSLVGGTFASFAGKSMRELRLHLNTALENAKTEHERESSLNIWQKTGAERRVHIFKRGETSMDARKIGTGAKPCLNETITRVKYVANAAVRFKQITLSHFQPTLNSGTKYQMDERFALNAIRRLRLMVGVVIGSKCEAVEIAANRLRQEVLQFEGAA